MRGAVDPKIRKLRKKLRQIENLERLDRDLTEEETDKVLSKIEIRRALLDLLSQQPPEEEVSCDMSNDVSYDSAYTEESSFNPVAQDSDSEEDSFTEDTEKSNEPIDVKQELPHLEETPTVENAGDGSGDAPVLPQKRKASDQSEIQDRPVPGQSPTSESHSRGQGDGAPTKKTKKDKSKLADLTPRDQSRYWRGQSFLVQTLEGHNDVVRAMDTDGELLVSAGNDTMVKVWNLRTGSEQRSFGGHTGPVTSVVLLSISATQALGETNDLAKNDRVVVSGSHDCSIRMWSVNTGQMIRSIYTYSPLTCLKYLDDASLLVSGSDGGKLELWSPVTGDSIHSFVAYEDGISAMETRDKYVYTASVDGTIKIFELRGQNLHTMFVSENIKLVGGGEFLRRQIRCLTVVKDRLYFGDDGMNVKVLDWKLALVHKLTNHTNEFGTTDALCCHANLLLSSGYDLDNGIGYVNVRCVPEEKYLCTLCDDDTSRVTCIACHVDQTGMHTIITGGLELKIWRQLKGKAAKNQQGIFPADFDQRFDKPARNSDLDSESEFSESDIEDRGPYIPAARRVSVSSEESRRGWFSWCTVL